MAAVKPPSNSADLVPPPETFWKKYSPHYEFPISTVATGVLHVLAVTAIIIIATRLMKPDEKTPVPVRSISVRPDGPTGSDGGEAGSGGGEMRAEAKDERPQDPVRELPEVELKREIASASTWNPDLKDNPEALKTLVESPNYKKLEALNPDLKKIIAEGMSGKRGGGTEEGVGASKDPGSGKGAGGPGDPSSSGNRSNRWVITFRTLNGPDYVKQLAAFNAKIVVPEPPDFKKNRIFDDLNKLPSQGRPLVDKNELPEMHFIDSDAGSARRVARALGLDYDPPYFLAFFPKAVENDLAAKEKAFRNRREDQIRQTTFNVIERNGKYEIFVTEQVPSVR